MSVVLPALDEAGTIGGICRTITRELVEEVPFVDELIVIDSGSSDGTAEVATASGAVVHRAEDLMDLGPARGKGDCLWRSLSIVTGDIVVWLDADTTNLHRGFVLDLVAPLLGDQDFVMTKAFYDRPLVTEDRVLATEGARITELVARPLLQLFYPELLGVIQPLSGEYAGFTKVFRDIPLFTGYGVEVGMLLDIADRFGPGRIAQVDLGTRVHRNRSLAELGRSSFQVISALLQRLDDLGRMKIPEQLPQELVQFVATPEGHRAIAVHLGMLERPPMNEL